MVAVEVKNLVKNYGELQAVKGISFNINKGEIFGLIGPNGAGKTTTLRIISTLLTITSGNITVMGLDLEKKPDMIRRVISYLPEDAGAYKNLTGRAYLEFISNFYEPRKAKQMVIKGVEIRTVSDANKNIKFKEFTKISGNKKIIIKIDIYINK